MILVVFLFSPFAGAAVTYEITKLTYRGLEFELSRLNRKSFEEAIRVTSLRYPNLSVAGVITNALTSSTIKLTITGYSPDIKNFCHQLFVEFFGERVSFVKAWDSQVALELFQLWRSKVNQNLVPEQVNDDHFRFLKAKIAVGDPVELDLLRSMKLSCGIIR